MRVFVLGIGAAALVIIGGALNTHRLQRHEAELQKACEATNKKPAPSNVSTQNIKQVAEALVNADKAGATQDALQLAQYLVELEQKSTQISGYASDGKHLWENDPLVCNAAELVRGDGTATFVGLQADIVNAYRTAQSSYAWPKLVALALVCLGAVPWVWYFLLRRLAEVRRALSGQPPNS